MKAAQVPRIIEQIDRDIEILRKKLQNAFGEEATAISKGIDNLLYVRRKYAPDPIGGSVKLAKAGDKMAVEDREGVVEGAYYKVALLDKDGNLTKQIRYINIE